MSEKKYTPYEVALEVLKKAQEVYNKHKEEALEKAHKFSNFPTEAEKKQSERAKNKSDSIFGQGKTHEKSSHEKGVNQPASDAKKEGNSVAGVQSTYDRKAAKKTHEKTLKEIKGMKKPDLPKSEDMDKCGDMKTVGKKEEKKEDLEKFVATGSMAPGSVASTGGPSLGSQIGFGKSDKKEYSGKVGDVDPKIISDMKSKLSDAKKDKKLPEFLKKKKMKKANAGGSEDTLAPKAPKAGSPQPPSISGDQGWSNAKKSEEGK
jgi:DNA-directed RNA polymerase subunit F